MNINRKSFLSWLGALFVLPKIGQSASTDRTLVRGNIDGNPPYGAGNIWDGVTAFSTDKICTAHMHFEKHEFLAHLLKSATEAIQKAQSACPENYMVGRISWHQEDKTCDPHEYTGHIQVLMVPRQKFSAWKSYWKSWRS